MIGLEGYADAHDPKRGSHDVAKLSRDDLEARKARLRGRFPDIKV